MVRQAQYYLERFLEVQETDYPKAYSEIKQGRKHSHWMWYIFPQIQGLGFSETTQFYAIKNKGEAEAYAAHPVLGRRLKEISKALLHHQNKSAFQIFGSPDDLKLQSSMTLFAVLPGSDPVFRLVLEQFFGGKTDKRTLDILS